MTELRLRDWPLGDALLQLRGHCTGTLPPDADALVARICEVQARVGEVAMQHAGVFSIQAAGLSTWPQSALELHLVRLCTKVREYGEHTLISEMKADLIGRALREVGAPDLRDWAMRSMAIDAFIRNVTRVNGPVVVCDLGVLGRQIVHSHTLHQDPIQVAVLQLHFATQAEASLKRDASDEEGQSKRRRQL